MIYSNKTIRELPAHVSLLPPVIVRRNGGRVAIFTNGGITIKIDDTVTLEDVHSLWLRMPSKVVSNETGEWTVPGSKGNSYTVTLDAGRYDCTCRGYQFYRSCKHIKSISK